MPEKEIGVVTHYFDHPQVAIVKVSKAEVKAVPLTAHEFHGEWNYTLHPTK